MASILSCYVKYIPIITHKEIRKLNQTIYIKISKKKTPAQKNLKLFNFMRYIFSIINSYFSITIFFLKDDLYALFFVIFFIFCNSKIF